MTNSLHFSEWRNCIRAQRKVNLCAPGAPKGPKVGMFVRQYEIVCANDAGRAPRKYPVPSPPRPFQPKQSPSYVYVTHMYLPNKRSSLLLHSCIPVIECASEYSESLYSRIHIRIRHPVFTIRIVFVTWCIRSSPTKHRFQNCAGCI